MTKFNAHDFGPLRSETVDFRPTTQEAAYEATLSPDTHWTSQVTRIGQTRISRRCVMSVHVGTDMFAALELVAIEDHGFLAR